MPKKPHVTAAKAFANIKRGNLNDKYPAPPSSTSTSTSTSTEAEAKTKSKSKEPSGYNFNDVNSWKGIITSALGSLFEAYMIAELTGIPDVEVVAEGIGRKEFYLGNQALERIFLTEKGAYGEGPLNQLKEELRGIAKVAVGGINDTVKDAVNKIINEEIAKSNRDIEAANTSIIRRLAGTDLPSNTSKGDIFIAEIIVELKYSTSNTVKWLTTSLEKIFYGGTSFKEYIENSEIWGRWKERTDTPEGDVKFANMASFPKRFNAYYGAYAPNGIAGAKATLNFILSKNDAGSKNKHLVIGQKNKFTIGPDGMKVYSSLTLNMGAIMEKISQKNIAVSLHENKYKVNGAIVMTVTPEGSVKTNILKAAKDNAPFPKTSTVRFMINATTLYNFIKPK